MDPKLIDDLARRLAETLPPGIRALQSDLEDNFKTVLQNVLARFDLVTREEFDVQSAVMRRTRDKLEKMATRLKELEDALKKQGPSA